jgi:hypothetical protein
MADPHAAQILMQQAKPNGVAAKAPEVPDLHIQTGFDRFRRPAETISSGRTALGGAFSSLR